MRTVYRLFALAVGLVTALSCGTVRKGAVASEAAPTPEEAAAVVASSLPEGAVFISKYLRVPSGQRIFGVCVRAEGLDRESARVSVFAPTRKGWNKLTSIDYPAVPSSGFSLESFIDSLDIVTLNGQERLHFHTLASDSAGRHKSLSSYLYGTQDESFHFLSFSGKPLSDDPLRIEGRSNEAMAPSSAEVSWISAELAADGRLLHLSDADIMADDAVEWWLEKNPGAMTGASSLNFGVIPAECSLVARYKASSDKQACSRYRAGLFDYRGYTSVVAQNRSTGEYMLVWTEPECKDHARGRLLNNIYFEQGGSTLVLFYYQGRKTFKYRINLSSKTLRR